MPTQRQRKTRKGSEDIVGKDLVVMWEDAGANFSDYFHPQTVETDLPAILCRSVGKCIAANQQGLYLAEQEFAGQPAPYRNVLRIPGGMIRDVKILRT